MLPSRFSPQSVSGMEFKDPHGPWSRARCSRQHGLKLGVEGAADGRFGASARDYYSPATMAWFRLRKLQHVPLVARIPPLRPVVVCGGLLAVLRDCCWGLSSHTIVEFAKDQWLLDDVISITCSADGKPAVHTYQMFENEILVNDGNSSAAVWIRKYLKEGDFSYKCVANNTVGKTEKTVNVTVKGSV